MKSKYQWKSSQLDITFKVCRIYTQSYIVWKVCVTFQTAKQKSAAVWEQTFLWVAFVFASCHVLCVVHAHVPNRDLCESAAPVRGFLVVTVVRGEGGPVPALLYARTATWYRVLGRSPDTLAVGSSPAVLTRSAAASLSCCRQYRIC